MKGPPLPPPRFATINAALEETAQGPLGLTFVDAREDETGLPYAELRQRARKVVGALRDRGIGRGDTVALVLPTGAAFMDAFFGALLAGAVPVPLYPPVRLGRMDEYHRATARMLSASKARLVVTDSRVRLLLGQAMQVARPALGLSTAAELLAQGWEHEEEVSPDSTALVQFSSGSTVDPKPVTLTQANLVAQCSALMGLMPEQEQLGVSWLPLYHDMGLIGCLLSGVFFPGPLVLLPPEAFLARPALWLRALARHRGTVSAAPNFAYALCLKRVKDEDLAGHDLSAWRYALNGAEPVSGEVMRRFGERFARFGFDPASLMPVYGLSEASLAVTFTPRRTPLREASIDPHVLATDRRAAPGPRRLPSVGTPVPGTEVEIHGEDGAPLEDGRVGRVVARGPSVMRGYLDSPEASARALKGGWLDTGDLAFIRDGELYLCGRAKDLVIIRGANHPPQLFEECLDGVEGLRAGCAVAVGFSPDGSDGEALLILAERGGGAHGGDAALVDRIRAAVTERTGIRPHTVKVLEPGTLPRTSSGKMRRTEALRRYLSGELTAPRKVNALTMAAELAKSSVALVRSKLES